MRRQPDKVAHILVLDRVNRYQGLFFFDASFRPVPLEQNFIGVRGKVRSEQSRRNMDQAVFDKVRRHGASSARKHMNNLCSFSPSGNDEFGRRSSGHGFRSC
jgi:hypothetical protein